MLFGNGKSSRNKNIHSRSTRFGEQWKTEKTTGPNIKTSFTYKAITHQVNSDTHDILHIRKTKTKYKCVDSNASNHSSLVQLLQDTQVENSLKCVIELNTGAGEQQ